jgi:ribosomal protein S18 acetylase RimI-like enzyme
MLIRRATFDDVPALIEIGKRGHAASDNARYHFNESKAKLLLAQLITGKQTCIFVAESGAKIVGFLMGQEEQYVYCDLRYATDIAMYAEEVGAGKKLLDRFTSWAFDERKVDQLLMGVSHRAASSKRTEALYRRRGFEHVGGIFTKQRVST